MARRVRSDNRRAVAWLDRDTLVISLIYAVAWFFLLLNGGRYWDDWCMVKLSTGGALLMGDMIGQVWQPYYWLALSWLPWAEYAAHGLTFALFLSSAVFLNRLLRRLPGLDRNAQVLIPAIFAVFPVNGARFAQVNFQYTLSLWAFYFAWYLIARDIDHPRLLRRIVAGALFAAAMITMNSLMVFIVLVPFYILWADTGAARDYVRLRQLIIRYCFLLALPIGALILRSTVLSPWGLYGGYNSISAAGLAEGLALLPRTVRASFLSPLKAAAPWLLLAIPIYLLLRRRWRGFDPNVRQHFTVLIAGIVAFVLGVLPYIAVQKIPQAIGLDWWDSRHQALVPLGAAMMLYGGVAFLGSLLRARRSVVVAILVAFLIAFAISDLRISLAYQADWYKQVSLMRHMETSADFRAGNYFILRDDAVSLNAVGRRYLPYELSGMMYRVFGDPVRFALDESMSSDYAAQLTAYGPYEQYHWSRFGPPVRKYLVHVSPGAEDISNTSTLLGLMLSEHLAPRDFDQAVLKVITVETVPIPDSQ